MYKKYELYGFLIESDMEFMQLLPANKSDVEAKDIISIKKSEVQDEVNRHLDGKNVNYDVGFDVSCFRNKSGYFLVKNGEEILYEIKQGVDISKLSPFILGYCMAMALLQKRVLAIHCSAVCFPKGEKREGALLIVGNSGAGKSTLTRKLIDKGFGFMADDMAAIDINEEIFVKPAFPYQKLCKNEVEANNMDQKELIYIDEDKDKYLIPVKNIFIDVPQKLLGMICIIPAECKNVEIHKLSGIDQLLMFRNNVFMHKLKGQWENDKQFLDLCIKAAGMCPVYVITRPIGKDTAEGMAEKIISLDI